MKNKKVARMYEQPTNNNYTPKMTFSEVIVMIVAFLMMVTMIVAFWGRFFYLW